MDAIERTLRASWRHRVLFTDHLFDPANLTLQETFSTESSARPAKSLVVVDETLAKAEPRLVPAISNYFVEHGGAMSLAARPLLMPGGEPAKNSWSHVSELHAAIDRYHLDRHSYLIVVGGGGLLDMAGLAAATAHRGVRHVRVPTTTLSQCDSGVGVKNGINAFGKKNFIGTFCPPWAVINDFQLLATLSARDQRSGYAEAVKVACVRDRAFFESLERDAAVLRAGKAHALRALIRRCAELHLDHIASGGDPFESGSARPLDFGHWAAHKLEQLSGFRLRHGEAVAIGLALDVVYSRRRGFLEAGDAERVLRLLEVLGFELFAAELAAKGPRQDWPVLAGLEEFREHLGGELAITLLRGLGSGFEVHEMDAPQVIESIQELQARDAARKARGELARA